MELTFKQIALIRRSLIPQVEILQSDRVWSKREAAACWNAASPDNSYGVVKFQNLNYYRDIYRQATADLAEAEGILAACKREERRLQKRRGLEVEWERLYRRMLDITDQLHGD
jgi:hypothetical protein